MQLLDSWWSLIAHTAKPPLSTFIVTLVSGKETAELRRIMIDDWRAILTIAVYFHQGPDAQLSRRKSSGHCGCNMVRKKSGSSILWKGYLTRGTRFLSLLTRDLNWAKSRRPAAMHPTSLLNAQFIPATPTTNGTCQELGSWG